MEEGDHQDVEVSLLPDAPTRECPTGDVLTDQDAVDHQDVGDQEADEADQDEVAVVVAEAAVIVVEEVAVEVEVNDRSQPHGRQARRRGANHLSRAPTYRCHYYADSNERQLARSA